MRSSQVGRQYGLVRHTGLRKQAEDDHCVQTVQILTEDDVEAWWHILVSIMHDVRPYPMKPTKPKPFTDAWLGRRRG